MTTTSRIYRTWQERILSGTFTKAQCQQFAAAIVPLATGLAMVRGKATNLTEHEARGLREAIWQAGGMRLTDQHTEQGLRWMRDKRNIEHFPQRVLDTFSHFTYQGDGYNMNADTNRSWTHSHLVPVWRIHTVDRATLDYCAAAWQSGQDITPRLLPA